MMMAAETKVPYVQAPGYIPRVLDKITTAQTPERFTQDFLATVLGFKGGSVRPVIPFLKKIGFLATDGTPTDWYKRFRNSQDRGAIVAAALKRGYQPLYEINEYIHEADDKAIKGSIVQATGADANSPQVKFALGTFKALRQLADFGTPLEETEAAELPVPSSTAATPPLDRAEPAGKVNGRELSLGYTINLHLPATSDVAVFNAIFRSLRENLLDQ